MSNQRGGGDPDEYGREAMAAFAHDMRTPLTTIRMVTELARRQSPEHELRLDGELAEMFEASARDLTTLADALQETSRLRRGKQTLPAGPCELTAVVEATQALLTSPVELAGHVPAGIRGPWDLDSLSRALAGLIETANRAGGGTGSVAVKCENRQDACEVTLSSGQPGGAMSHDIGPELGFAYFHARQVVMALGGHVTCTRGYQCATIALTLPWKRGSRGEA